MKCKPSFVWARIEYFCPGVQGTGIRVVHNMPLLLQTQSADPGHRIEDPSPVNDLPFECIWDSRITQF